MTTLIMLFLSKPSSDRVLNAKYKVYRYEVLEAVSIAALLCLLLWLMYGNTSLSFNMAAAVFTVAAVATALVLFRIFRLRGKATHKLRDIAARHGYNPLEII